MSLLHLTHTWHYIATLHDLDDFWIPLQIMFIHVYNKRSPFIHVLHTDTSFFIHFIFIMVFQKVCIWSKTITKRVCTITNSIVLLKRIKYTNIIFFSCSVGQLVDIHRIKHFNKNLSLLMRVIFQVSCLVLLIVYIFLMSVSFCNFSLY